LSYNTLNSRCLGVLHTFVGLLSDSGVPVEEIARLSGHATTRTTELAKRRKDNARAQPLAYQDRAW